MKSGFILFKKFQINYFLKDETYYIAVKPICTAFGIDFSAQLKKLKNDPKFASGVASLAIPGADKKVQEMTCLPTEYLFGWLFTIDSRLVKEEVKAHVLEYQLECVKVLNDYFIVRFQKEVQLLEQVETYKTGIKTAMVQIEKLRKARHSNAPELF